MKASLTQALDAIVKMDAHDARKVRDMTEARLRELDDSRDRCMACGVPLSGCYGPFCSCRPENHVGYTDDF